MNKNNAQQHNGKTERDLEQQSRRLLDQAAEELALENRPALARARAAALNASSAKKSSKGRTAWLFSAAAVASLSAILLLPASSTSNDAAQTVDVLENMDMLLWMNEHPEVL